MFVSRTKISCVEIYKNVTNNNSQFLNETFKLKDALSGLRQFLAIESSLKMMKNSFYFTSEALSFSRS